MRDSYYLPWDEQITEWGELRSRDDTGHDAVKYLAQRVSNETRYTELQAAEVLYRLIGHMCEQGKTAS